LIAAGVVTVNDEPGRPGLKLKHGDLVAYAVELKEPAVDTRIILVHEEPAFAVAIKPGQLPSHADGNFIKHTFIHLIQGVLKKVPGEARLVHRLDRETSGLMVVSRDKEAHAHLMRQFAAGTVEKAYTAVVTGRIDRERFEVSGWLGRDPASAISVRHALVPEGTPGAKDSRTEFVVEEVLKDATVVRCIPHTGRTNQIRVHLTSIGHPIVGDKLYGGTEPALLAHCHRQALHAHRISFRHPATGEQMTFESPLPPDIAALVEHLRSGNPAPPPPPESIAAAMIGSVEAPKEPKAKRSRAKSAVTKRKKPKAPTAEA